MSDAMRERAIENLRYGLGQAGAAIGLGHQVPMREPTELEIAEAEERQRAWQRQLARREALSHTLALGRRYDAAEDAIRDAKVIAEWIGLEID